MRRMSNSRRSQSWRTITSGSRRSWKKQLRLLVRKLFIILYFIFSVFEILNLYQKNDLSSCVLHWWWSQQTDWGRIPDQKAFPFSFASFASYPLPLVEVLSWGQRSWAMYIHYLLSSALFFFSFSVSQLPCHPFLSWSYRSTAPNGKRDCIHLSLSPLPPVPLALSVCLSISLCFSICLCLSVSVSAAFIISLGLVSAA